MDSDSDSDSEDGWRDVSSDSDGDIEISDSEDENGDKDRDKSKVKETERQEKRREKKEKKEKRRAKEEAQKNGQEFNEGSDDGVDEHEYGFSGDEDDPMNVDGEAEKKEQDISTLATTKVSASLFFLDLTMIVYRFLHQQTSSCYQTSEFKPPKNQLKQAVVAVLNGNWLPSKQISDRHASKTLLMTPRRPLFLRTTYLDHARRLKLTTPNVWLLYKKEEKVAKNSGPGRAKRQRTRQVARRIRRKPETNPS